MRRTRSVLSILAALMAVGIPAWSQAPVLVSDREAGEEDQIRKRAEWFQSTRRAGTSSDADAARRRAAAVSETASRAARQRAIRALAGGDATNLWAPMGPAASHFGGWSFGDVSGRVTALARDAGGTLYVGAAAGGVWKSVNDGLSWTQLFDSAGTHTVGAIAVDPNAASVLWVGTGDFVEGCDGYFGIGLLRSTDGGTTWEARNGTGGSTLQDMSNFSSVVVDPRNSNHLVVGGRVRGCSSGSQATGGLFTTNDAGATWTQRLASTEIHEIVQNPTTQDTWWAATGKGIYRSTDNGVTWVLQTASGLPNGNTGRTEIAIAPSNPQVIYALFESPSQFWRTTNGGSSWSMMSSGSSACDGQCWYNMVLRVHPTQPDTVYRGTVHIFKSVNGGTNWTDVSNSWGPSQTVHQDTHAFLTVAANPSWLYVGSDGGVWKSVDAGASFVGLNSNLEMTQFYAIGVHPTNTGIICGGAQDNSSLARGSGTNVWDLQAVTGDGFVCAINPVDPSYAYITSYPSGGYPSVSRSTTGVFGSFGGITGAGSGIIGGDRSNWVTPYLLDPNSPNILYLGTQRVYKSVNHGTTWTPTNPSDMTGGGGTVYSLEVNRNFPSRVFAGTDDGRVWRSTDAAGSWTNITSGLPARSINDIAGDPTSADRLLVVVGGFGTAHLWEKVADGPWVARGGGLPDVPANTVLLLTGSDVLVGTDVGVFRSQDGGASFVPYMDGLPDGIVVTDLEFDRFTNTLTAGTYGRGAWQVQVDPVEPIVIFDSIVLPLVAVDGDGDANVEPGETWSVTPVLRNVGGQTAHGVTAAIATATAGVTIAAPSTRSFGDLASGASAPASQPIAFTVDPAFGCGGTIVFDLVSVASTNAPNSYPPRSGAFTVTVVDHFEADVVTTPVDEDFDPVPSSGWTHNVVNPGLSGCSAQTYKDDWKLLSKDAAHGQSYHCGNGPGTNYPGTEYAWLHVGGKDSTNGPGITIPADAASARLTLVHWYSTQSSQDGGQVAIDATLDDLDVFTTLTPESGYPGSLLTNLCNGLEGKPAFTGSSGGWITSTFDLSNQIGKTIYLAFIFGSDRFPSANEGWYLDLVKVESRKPGTAVCQVTRWPGTVAGNASFERAGSDVLATWGDSCNLGAVPGQGYSIQSGDLDALRADGTYTHAPIGGACGRLSPSFFTPGPGNEYYLVVPNAAGAREGGAGLDGSGAARPQPSAVCGARRVEACP